MAADSSTIGPAIARASFEARANAVSWAEAYGAASVGQFTVAFVDWVRRQCEDESIKHIEFLARDGFLPFQVAQALPSDYFGDITLGYMHANRRAWGLAAADVIGVEAWRSLGLKDSLSFLLHAATQVPWSSVLGRCGLDPSDLPADHGLTRVEPNELLIATQVDDWAELLESGALDTSIARAASERAHLVRKAIRQRNLGARRIALVDVGWRGQQAWLISSLIEDVTGQRPINLHFGADGPDPDIDRHIDVRRFALDDSVEPHPVHAPVLCLETYLAPGTPRLTDYRRDRNGVVHEVFDSTGAGVDSPTRVALSNGAVAVARSMPGRGEIEHLDASRSGVRSLLTELWSRPTPDEVRVIETLRFELDDAGTVVVPIVSPYRPREFVRRSGVRRLWSEGSAAITPPLMRFVVTRLLQRGAH